VSLLIEIYPGSTKRALELNSTWPIRVKEEISLNYKLKYSDSFFNFQPLFSSQTPHILKQLHDLLHRCPQFHSSHVMSRQMQAFNAARSVTEQRRQSVGTQTAWGPQISAVRDCSFSIFAANIHTGGRFSIRNLRSRHTEVTGTHLSRSVHIINYLIKCICLTVLKNTEFYVTDNMAADLMLQQTKGFQRRFKHHLLNSMFCRTCQPFVLMYYFFTILVSNAQ